MPLNKETKRNEIRQTIYIYIYIYIYSDCYFFAGHLLDSLRVTVGTPMTSIRILRALLLAWQMNELTFPLSLFSYTFLWLLEPAIEPHNLSQKRHKLLIDCCSGTFVKLVFDSLLSWDLTWPASLPRNKHCPVGWGCRIHRLHLCRGVRPPPRRVSRI